MIEVKNLKKEFVQNGKPLEILSGISTEFKGALTFLKSQLPAA